MRPRDTQVLTLLALSYAELGDKVKARHALDQVSRFPLNDPELLFHSAVAYELIGDRNQAFESLRAAIQAGYSGSEIQSAPELVHLRADSRYSFLVGIRH